MKEIVFPNNLTWEELAQFIANMSPDDRKNNVSVYDAGMDEFFPVPRIGIAEDKDDNPAAGVLDEGHPYLVIADSI